MRKVFVWALAVSISLCAAPSFAQETAPAPQPNVQVPHVSTDSSTRPRDLSQQVVKTFRLQHISQPTEMQDIVNMLRTILEFQRVQPVPSIPAVVVRGNPEQVSMAEKLIAELDQPRSRSVMSTDATDYRLDYAITEFDKGQKLATHNYTVVIQRGNADHGANKSMFKVGSRVPVATGSFQSGSGSGASPLVNTQFNYVDIGANIDATLSGSDSDLMLLTSVEFSGVASAQNIGGINQPVIRQSRTTVSSALVPGKPTLIASLDDVDAPRKIEIAVTATKLK